MSAYAKLGRQVGSGIGSFFGSPQARQAGEMAGLQAVALEDQINQRREEARLRAQEADRAAALQSPDAALQRIAPLAGVPTNAVGALKTYFETGKLPDEVMTPGDQMAPGLAGPVRPATPPEWGSKDNLSKIAQMFWADRSSQSGSAKTMKDAIEALLLQPKVSLTAGVSSGQISPQVGGQRFAALDGKPLVSPQEFGSVDLFTGAVDASGPVAQRFGQYRQAQTGAQNANAAQSYASANASNASAALSRAKTAQVGQGGVLTTDPTTGEQVVVNTKPMPTSALKLQDEATEAATSVAVVNDRIDSLLSKMQDGTLNLGLYNNWVARGRNFAGLSNEQSKAFSDLDSAIEEIRNGVLLLNKGVQTEGDAQRALNQIVRNINDPGVVRQALERLRKKNEEAADLQVARANRVRSNYGNPGLTLEGLMPGYKRRPDPGKPPAPTGGQPVRVTSDAEYNALPPGTRFITPDGKTGTKR